MFDLGSRHPPERPQKARKGVLLFGGPLSLALALRDSQGDPLGPQRSRPPLGGLASFGEPSYLVVNFFQ